MSFVGATLKFSPSVSPSNVAPKYSAILSGVLEDTKRPHTPATLPGSDPSPVVSGVSDPRIFWSGWTRTMPPIRWDNRQAR